MNWNSPSVKITTATAMRRCATKRNMYIRFHRISDGWYQLGCFQEKCIVVFSCSKDTQAWRLSIVYSTLSMSGRSSVLIASRRKGKKNVESFLPSSSKLFLRMLSWPFFACRTVVRSLSIVCVLWPSDAIPFEGMGCNQVTQDTMTVRLNTMTFATRSELNALWLQYIRFQGVTHVRIASLD